MALVGRSPIKVTAAPSTAPQEAMAASLQAHIDELVQKNRTCEHTIRRLQQALADEKERGIEAVSRIKSEMQLEREEWREGCDSLLASHRIVHIRTSIELDKERLNVQLEREDNRRERINILHRDYRLILFQAKESELEARIGSLEDALEFLTDEHEQDAQEYMERIRTLEKELKKVERSHTDVVLRLKNREAEFASLQSELSALGKENVTLKASFESSSVKLERTALQLEGAKTDLAELETANGELKRTNADLKRQLDRWQSLETKGGAEVEEMRKRKIELEVQVKELQNRVKDLEKAEKESMKALEKERSKVEKLKKENDRMAEVTEEAQSIAKKAQDEYDEAAEQLCAAQRLVEKLQSEKMSGDQVRKGKKPAREVKVPAAGESLDPSEREVEMALTPAPKSRVWPRPAFRGKDTSEMQQAVEIQEEAEPSQRVKSRSKTGASKKKQKAGEIGHSTEHEDHEARQAKRSNKAEGARSKDETLDVSENDEASQQVAKKERSGTTRSKGKEKAAQAPSDSEDESGVKRKGKTSKPDVKKDGVGAPSSTQSKVRSQGPRIKVVDSAGEADAQPKKKKKRLFPPSQAETFPWDDLPKGEGFSGLNIPTQLSPVKETDAVPARSVFGKVGSALGFR